MKIHVTVAYPVYLALDVKKPKNDSEIFELRNVIKDEADKILGSSSISSVIHQCDELPELVE